MQKTNSKRARKIPFSKSEKLDALLYKMKRGDDTVFPRVVAHYESLKGFQRYCERKGKRYNLIILDGDDLYQVALETIWKSVSAFRFFCPLCDAKLETRREFLQHQFKRHKKSGLRPRVSISDYVAMCAYNEMRRVIRYESSRKRNLTISSTISLEEVSEQSEKNSRFGKVERELATESAAESFLRVAELLTFAENELDEKSLTVLRLAATGFTKKEIAAKMVRSGFSVSLRAAERSVKKILQRRANYVMKFIGA